MQLKTSCLHVKKGGVSLVITDDTNGRIGRCKISNATLTWFPKDQKKGFVLNWTQLGEFAINNGTKKK